MNVNKFAMLTAGFAYGILLTTLWDWLPFDLWIFVMISILLFGFNFHNGLEKEEEGVGK